MTAGADFAARAMQFRPELLAHCYRMLGSVHDAEDLVQETMVRAWRAADRFDEHRGSLRTWLYRIATNACLTALDQRGRRALPTGLVGPSDDPGVRPERNSEIPWIEPIPDALLGNSSDDPAVVVAARSGIRLAFVAALQHLPARQRAVLILRDVLAWSAADVADLLDTTRVGVNSALQRSHTQLEKAAPMLDQMSESLSPDERVVIDRYTTAFSDADVPGLAELPREDVVLEMPTALLWFAGRDDAVAFLAHRVLVDHDTWRAVPTAANTQPAVACCRRKEDGVYRANSIHLLTVTDKAVERLTVFVEPRLFESFGLPEVYED